MRSSPRSWAGAILGVVVGLAACGRGDATAEPAAPALEAPRDPWALPADSLYGATAVDNLQVRPVELELRGVPRGWDGLRIALLSDLQLGLWADNAQVAEAAVRRAVELEPDLVVLLGDYVAVGEHAAALDRVLAPLRGHPALAVLGDRDLELEARAADIVGRLERHGITVLRNQVVAFARGPDTAYIAGIEPDFVTFTAAQQARLFEGLPEGVSTPLLLSHLPIVLTRLPERRFPAVLAGHTFCGEIDVPGTPTLATLLEETLPANRVPRTRRLFQHAGNTMFVTCGLGYSFVPARSAAPPELALVTLLRMPDPLPEADADTPVPD